MIYLGYYYDYNEAVNVYNDYHNKKLQDEINKYKDVIPNDIYDLINKVWNI